MAVRIIESLAYIYTIADFNHDQSWYARARLYIASSRSIEFDLAAARAALRHVNLEQWSQARVYGSMERAESMRYIADSMAERR